MFLNYAASTKHSNSLAHPISIPQLGKSLHAVIKFSQSSIQYCISPVHVENQQMGIFRGRGGKRIVKDVEETAYFKITR